jgi:glycosyltransferase involved in cell wall biosynthesis
MISFVIPAYNESKNIKQTVEQIVNSCISLNINEFEILIIDDNSDDDTENTFYQVANIYPKVNLIYHKNNINLGFGGSVIRGLKLAKHRKVLWLPGDNSHSSSEINKVLIEKEEHDIVSTYYTNAHERTAGRRIFTKFYTPFLNMIYGLNVPYYNGFSLINKRIINQINIKTKSHCWQVELWVKAKHIKNFNFIFVPTVLQDRVNSPNAFKLKNSIKVIYAIFRLFLFNLFFSLKSKFFD